MHGRKLSAGRTIDRTHPLYGRKIYIPRMPEGSSRAVAAVMRSIGVNADVAPKSCERTLELGGRHSSGDECYPLKVTLGDFLRVTEQPDFDPKKTAFFMATGQGPCRFGQYVPYLRSVLDKLGYHEVVICHPSCERGYSDFGDAADVFTRGAWRALVSADILMKRLLKSRPYEVVAGSADDSYEECLKELCEVLETPFPNDQSQMIALQECLLRARRRFRELRVELDDGRPLIGVVGEIYCRLNEFSNRELVKRLEEAGAEVWLNDLCEWIWYVNADQFDKLKLYGRQISWDALRAYVRNHIQHKDGQALQSSFREDFRGYEEPQDIQEVLDYAQPYLPASGVNGEMVLNVGKAVYFAHQGLDGVVDISPFTCMNGIVGEAVYPRVSRDNGGIPIRNFYFDGTQSDLERDIGIFVELARSYQVRKQWQRPAAATAQVSVRNSVKI